MERLSVNSSNLASVGYDETSQTLEIEFLSGVIYEFYEVPTHVHQELMSASSVGSYFAREIRKIYNYAQIG